MQGVTSIISHSESYSVRLARYWSTRQRKGGRKQRCDSICIWYWTKAENSARIQQGAISSNYWWIITMTVLLKVVDDVDVSLPATMTEHSETQWPWQNDDGDGYISMSFNIQVHACTQAGDTHLLLTSVATIFIFSQYNSIYAQKNIPVSWVMLHKPLRLLGSPFLIWHLCLWAWYEPSRTPDAAQLQWTRENRKPCSDI